jgi:hypothetical protein
MRDRTVSLIGRAGDSYLIQARDVVKPELIRGKYNFIFPGACSFFGGGLREREHQKSGLTRVVDGQLEGLILPWILEPTVYVWRRDLSEIMERLDSVFGGNVNVLLGFDLDGKIPQQALGNDRGDDLSYRAFLYGLDQDHYFVADFEKGALDNVNVREGVGAYWVKHQIARSLVMVPGDKLALLDDIASRVLAGELKI